MRLTKRVRWQQFGQLLSVLSRHRPLVPVLDDPQWIDEASASLLCHLTQRLEDGRVLLVGAFRAFPVKSGRGGERHSGGGATPSS